MTCDTVKLPNGVIAIVCSRGRRQNCSMPRCTRPGTLLCDYPVAEGRTCDRRMCKTHAAKIAANKHYCPQHQVGASDGRPGPAAPDVAGKGEDHVE
jgi:hypothetical protein